MIIEIADNLSFTNSYPISQNEFFGSQVFTAIQEAGNQPIIKDFDYLPSSVQPSGTYYIRMGLRWTGTAPNNRIYLGIGNRMVVKVFANPA